MHWLWAADRLLFLALDGHPAGAPFRAVAEFLLRISTGGALWLGLFALGFIAGGPRGRRVAVTGALAVLIAHVVAVWGLQGLFQRADPSHQLAGAHVLTAFQPVFSFPATRVAQAFAALPYLSRSGGAGTVLFWGLAVAVAVSCVYAGIAFPTDVLGGMAVGWATAAGARWILGDPFIRRRGAIVPLARSR